MLWIVALFAWVLTEAMFMCIVIVAGRADDRMERWTSTPETHDLPNLASHPTCRCLSFFLQK